MATKRKTATGATVISSRDALISVVVDGNPNVEAEVVAETLATLDDLYRMGIRPRSYNLESPYSSKRTVRPSDDNDGARLRVRSRK